MHAQIRPVSQVSSSKFRSVLAALSMAVLLSACATPQTRIEDDPQTFAGATPEQQTQIQQGHVDLGMTPPMVKIALGDPDQVSEQVTKEGTFIVWHYAADVSPYPYPYPAWRGRAFAPLIPVNVAGPADKFRVVFHDDKVISAERIVN
jgi:hypothetical protein